MRTWEERGGRGGRGGGAHEGGRKTLEGEPVSGGRVPGPTTAYDK